MLKTKTRKRLSLGAALGTALGLGLTTLAVAPANASDLSSDFSTGASDFATDGGGFTPDAVFREAVYTRYNVVTGYVFNEGAFCASKGQSLSDYLRAPLFIADIYIICVRWVAV